MAISKLLSHEKEKRHILPYFTVLPKEWKSLTTRFTTLAGMITTKAVFAKWTFYSSYRI
jgi:hypothetical protein